MNKKDTHQHNIVVNALRLNNELRDRLKVHQEPISVDDLKKETRSWYANSRYKEFVNKEHSNS